MSATARPLVAIDHHLLSGIAHRKLAGFPGAAIEFLYFVIKEARACLFVVLFFAAILLVPRAGIAGLPRYDVLLVVALLVQFWMVSSGL